MNKAILQGQHHASRTESALNQDSLGQSGQQAPSSGACIVPVILHRRRNNGPGVLSPALAGPFCAAGDRRGGAARHAVHPAEPPLPLQWTLVWVSPLSSPPCLEAHLDCLAFPWSWTHLSFSAWHRAQPKDPRSKLLTLNSSGLQAGSAAREPGLWGKS